MLRSRTWRPANNPRNFSRSCLRQNAESTGSLSPKNERSNVFVNTTQGSQAQLVRETDTNAPENARESWCASSVGDPKAQSSQSPLQLNSKATAYDLDTIKERARDWMTIATASFRQQTDELRQRAGQLTRKTSTKFFQLGSQLNRVTGYEQIEALKQRVVEQEARIIATRKAAREAKTAYDDSVLQRSLSQRQVNELLQRKSSWTDADVSAFTSLVRSDHQLEQHEVATKAKVAENEDALDREFGELMRAILARYHEEQVWSDKIRSASTYGSIMVLGVNVVVFILAIIVVEPWKRRRLAQTFEKKVEEMSAETRDLIESGSGKLDERLMKQEKLILEIVERAAYDARDILPSSVPVPAVAVSVGEGNVAEPTTLARLRWHPITKAVQGREVLLVVGSAIAGGAVTLVARSLFGS